MDFLRINFFFRRLQNKPPRPHTSICGDPDVVYQLFCKLFRSSCTYRGRVHNRREGKSIVISKSFINSLSQNSNTQPTIGQWRIVFSIAAAIYIICAIFYVVFGSGERQKWDNPAMDKEKYHTPKAVDNENGVKRRNVKETKY